MMPVNHAPHERTRKLITIVLQRLAPEGTQKEIATALSVSETTVSRYKDHIEPVCSLIAHLGLKLVDVNKECTSPDELRFLRRVYAIVQDQAPHLLNEDET